VFVDPEVAKAQARSRREEELAEKNIKGPNVIMAGSLHNLEKKAYFDNLKEKTLKSGLTLNELVARNN